MRLILTLLLLPMLLFAKKDIGNIQKEQWKTRLDSLLPQDPEYSYADQKLEITTEQTQQAKYYLIPRLELFHTSSISRENTSFKSWQSGISAQVNVFHFGRSHYNYLGQSSTLDVEKLEHRQKKIEIENRFLTSLFKNTLLQRKLSLYSEIENLKRKALKVAQQRYDRGNLPRQQVEKVDIDLTNLSSQRITTERELADSELEILKYQLGDFKREWPFTGAIGKIKKAKQPSEFVDVKILDLKTNAYENQLESSRRAYFPAIDLSGRAYQWKQDDALTTQEWDVSLTITWPLWDNYSRRIENLKAYREFQYWQTEKNRAVRDWEKRIQTKEDQLNKLTGQLNQSAANLKKLNALYADTEALFSQGRLTVNELFLDQQLLFETQINYENEMYAFHQFILDYCTFHSERVWDCF